MKKRFILFLLLISVIFLCSSCSAVNEKIQNKNFLDEEETITVKGTKNSEPLIGVELWSFEISENEDISEFLENYKNSGVDYIDFRILWSSFEVEKGKYNWSFFDNIMNQITDAGFSAGISLILWTNGLSFKDELEFQKTSDGNIYSFDESRAYFPSINSDKNKNIIFNTVQALANHVSEKYSENTVLWQVITSPFGDSGYSSEKDLDYGESSISAFYKYLSEKYKTTENFTDIYPLEIESFEELSNISNTKLTEICIYDWKSFKQQSLAEFQSEIGNIFKASNENIPFQLFFGGIEDTKAAIYRGFYDPYITNKTVDADIYSISLDKDVPISFTTEYLSETTEKNIGYTIYEETLTEEIKAKILEEAENISTDKITRICFDFSEMSEKNIEFLKTFSEKLKTEKKQKAENKDVAIFINTTDFILRNPVKNLYSSISEEYAEISEKGNKTVHIITDTMIKDGNENALKFNILKTASSGKYYYINTEIIDTLIKNQIEIFLKDKTSVEIRNEYGFKFSEKEKNKPEELFKE